jgi:2-polyprenyl-3-methyl-5-hydroxy-6-metoxy-1,4-benzoquinol methylase
MQNNKGFSLYLRYPGELDSNIDSLDNDNIIDEYWISQRDLNDVAGWDHRYAHESNIIVNVANNVKTKKILELGSGPGGLANKILTASPDLTYHMVDGSSAKIEHSQRNYKGNFFVKDLKDSFDYSDLDSDYDMVITNDFLEHIRNPSLILSTIYNKLTTQNAYYFCSSPNWRTKHGFYYPGLFDYDNLIKFFLIHKFQIVGQFPTWATHVPIRTGKLQSEQSVADDRVYDWNYYLLFKKI